MITFTSDQLGRLSETQFSYSFFPKSFTTRQRWGWHCSRKWESWEAQTNNLSVLRELLILWGQHALQLQQRRVLQGNVEFWPVKRGCKVDSMRMYFKHLAQSLAARHLSTWCLTDALPLQQMSASSSTSSKRKHRTHMSVPWALGCIIQVHDLLWPPLCRVICSSVLCRRGAGCCRRNKHLSCLPPHASSSHGVLGE